MCQVLIVEDDADTADSLYEIIREDGYETAYAQNRNDALKMIQAGARPAAMLMDIVMPGLSAEAFLDSVQADPDAPRIICTSASPIPEPIAQRCWAAVRKPFDAENLLDMLNAITSDRAE